jgi:hypothetical protein
MADRITVEIEDDGTITFTTDEISGENHEDADKFIKSLRKLLGGEHTVTKRTRGHQHKHAPKKATQRF